MYHTLAIIVSHLVWVWRGVVIRGTWSLMKTRYMANPAFAYRAGSIARVIIAIVAAVALSLAERSGARRSSGVPLRAIIVGVCVRRLLGSVA